MEGATLLLDADTPINIPATQARMTMPPPLLERARRALHARGPPLRSKAPSRRALSAGTSATPGRVGPGGSSPFRAACGAPLLRAGAAPCHGGRTVGKGGGLGGSAWRARRRAPEVRAAPRGLGTAGPSPGPWYWYCRSIPGALLLVLPVHPPLHSAPPTLGHLGPCSPPAPNALPSPPPTPLHPTPCRVAAAGCGCRAPCWHPTCQLSRQPTQEPAWQTSCGGTPPETGCLPAMPAPAVALAAVPVPAGATVEACRTGCAAR
jgi:hypothetical protein